MPTAGLLKKKVPPLKLRARLQAGLLSGWKGQQLGSQRGERTQWPFSCLPPIILLSLNLSCVYSIWPLCLYLPCKKHTVMNSSYMQVTGHHEQHLKETDAKLNSTKTARRNSRLPRGSLILSCAKRDLNWQQDESGRNWPNCAAICTILHRATSIS